MSGSFRQQIRRTALILFAGLAIVPSALLLIDYYFISPSIGPAAIWLVAAVALLLGGIGIALTNAFTDRLTRMMGSMTAAAREMSRGDRERRIEQVEMPLTELRDLADAINAMATRAKSDISEMKRLERVRSEFLGNVSHELRTPIFSVQGYLETLIDGAVDDRSVRDDFLNKAHQNVLRLHTLLTDLIEISRIESGEMKMSFRYFNAVEYFHAITEELRPTAEIAGVGLEFHVAGDHDDQSVSVLGDRERLKQALVNLIENAIKYNHPDGKVIVELESRDGEAVVRVRDNGVGIPQEDIGRIFERFYRVNKDRSRAVGGSGLGLAIVKHIVEAHGSTVRVESEFGRGSVFSFTLRK
jgi:two-component system phosphate regulon sensor histidine kinase PhoR